MPKERSIPWDLAGALVLHAVICITLLMMPTVQRTPPIPERSIEVEIAVLPVPPATARTEPPLQKTDPIPDPAATPGAPDEKAAAPTLPRDARLRPESPAMVKPTRMLSEKVLTDPRSWKPKKLLSRLMVDERVIQHCSVEAMAQVGAWKTAYQPDFLVAYAMADTKFSGNSLLADGAAFHSKQFWYNIRLKCDLAPNHKKVAAFEFLVGDAIPRRKWESHNLPAVVDNSDWMERANR